MVLLLCAGTSASFTVISHRGIINENQKYSRYLPCDIILQLPALKSSPNVLPGPTNQLTAVEVKLSDIFMPHTVHYPEQPSQDM